MTISDLLQQIQPNCTIIICSKPYEVKSKTQYTITDDTTVSYFKCVLDNHQALVIIPSDELIYIGGIMPNFNYKRISDNKIEYDGRVFHHTGDGHQIIVNVDFGDPEDVEGECDFEDYESDAHIISLGVLQNGERADVFAEKLKLHDIKVQEAACQLS